MSRKPLLLLCVVALASITAFAGSIPFSGSGSSGTLQTGQSFAYNGDGGVPIPNWGIPGVVQGTAVWNGPTVNEFLVTFDLPSGIILDPNQVILGSNSGCAGGSTGGTTFCALPFSMPWTPTLIGTNGIEFKSSGDLLTQGDLFFVNVFFEGGDPNGVSFSGEFGTVPEPASPMLIAPGLLAVAAGLRRKLLT